MIVLQFISLAGAQALSIDDCSTENVYCVVSDSASHIDMICSKVECNSLAHYMNNSIGSSSRYFKSNETYVFGMEITIYSPPNTILAIS